MADFPDSLHVNIQDAAGEISASVDETNRIRAAIGLKPLKEGKTSGTTAREEGEVDAHKRRQADAAASGEAAALAARLVEARERRALEAKIRSAKGLGDDDPAEDDPMAWVERSRKVAEDKRKADEKKKAEEQQRRLEEQDESDDDDDDAPRAKGKAAGPRYTAKDLAGLAVSHGMDDIEAGESMILTLKDSRIIGQDGELEEEDVLENVRVAELRKRDKALKAAKKMTAFEETDTTWEKKTVLGKYDDKKDEGLKLDEAGAVDAAKKARQEEIRRRLAVAAAGGSAAISAVEESADVGADGKSMADFYTAAEMEQFNKPKKLRKKKSTSRKKDGLGTAELEAIVRSEAEAGEGAGGGGGGGGDLGNRKAVKEALEAARKAKEDDAHERFDKAKSRAAATAAVAYNRGGPADDEGAIGGDDDADNELAAALERSRRAALANQAAKSSGAERVAENVRASAASAGGKAGAAGSNLDLDFSDTAEFVRNISVEKATAAAQSAAAARHEGIVIAGAPEVKPEPAGEAADVEMGDPAEDGEYIPLGADEDMEVSNGAGAGAKKEEGGGAGAWGAEAAPVGGREAEQALASAAEEAIGAEIKTSKGLGSVLAMLKQKNQLTEAVTWAGRNTDKQPHRVKEKVEAEQIETEDPSFKFGFSLDRYDEFGRKLTPKEAFRELCWRFHGMPPGKMKQEKRLKQWHEEQRRLSMREGDTPTGAMEKMREAQASLGTPYVILSGSVSAGQVSDSNSMYATLEKEAPSLTPLLGAQQPLTGAKKVEFMMGLKSNNVGGKRGAPGGGAAADSARMPPPPAKKPKGGA